MSYSYLLLRNTKELSHWGEKQPTSCLQGFTMEKVNLALCDKLKKLWSEDSGMDDKMTRF